MERLLLAPRRPSPSGLEEKAKHVVARGSRLLTDGLSVGHACPDSHCRHPLPLTVPARNASRSEPVEAKTSSSSHHATECRPGVPLYESLSSPACPPAPPTISRALNSVPRYGKEGRWKTQKGGLMGLAFGDTQAVLEFASPGHGMTTLLA
jgi:hypothetical protein